MRTPLALTVALFLLATPVCRFLYTEAAEPVSILNPAQPGSEDFRFKLDAIDPDAPEKVNGLIIYTPAAPTVVSGTVDATVIDGRVTRVGSGQTTVPENGFIASAKGNATQWLSRFAKPGARLWYDSDIMRVFIRHTPQVYLSEVDEMLKLAQSRQLANPEGYRKNLEAALRCRDRLIQRASGDTVTSEIVSIANECSQAASHAFYNTIASVPGEFRGTWLRPPANSNVEGIRKTIAELKKLGIQHIFLETYYQGRTIYPSEVMAAYELPTQHNQFRGWDPVKTWVEEAHREGLKLHLWVEVFFAGNKQENPEPYGPILEKYPQWRNIQQRHWNASVPVPSDVEPGHYFLDPANPEVRQFLEKLLLEMVSRYDIDGLNLDYIRYPASAPTSAGNYLNSTWGYTDAARSAFQKLMKEQRAETLAKQIEALKKARKPIPKSLTASTPADYADPVKLTPSHPLWSRWVEWRKELITSFVRDISTKARAMRPDLLVSAVVFPSSDPTYALKLQDYPLWGREGYIQALTPIGLSARPDLLRQQAEKIKRQVPAQVPVYIGIFGMYNRATPVALLQQIDAVHQAGMPGLMLFEWSRSRPEYIEALMEGPFRPETSQTSY